MHVDVAEVQRVKARREEAQRRLSYAHEQLARDDESTIRPLRVMIRENHISGHLDSIIKKVKGDEPGTSGY